MRTFVQGYSPAETWRDVGTSKFALSLSLIQSLRAPHAWLFPCIGVVSPLFPLSSARLLSVALERRGSEKVSSTLGTGRHPARLVPDHSKVQYPTFVAGRSLWQANICAIDVYVNRRAKVVSLPLLATHTRGQSSAILDTGVPFIVVSSALVYGIYDAMGYSPASYGNGTSSVLAFRGRRSLQVQSTFPVSC